MSNGWSAFVIVLVVGNILGMVWLLFATSKPSDLKDTDTTGHIWDGIEELNNPLPRWWLRLFVITIIFSIAYLYLYPGLGNFKGSKGWSQLGQYQAARNENWERQAAYFGDLINLSVAELASNKAAMSTAARLFAHNCATCHGSDAGGAKGFPNLRDDDWLYGDSPETIVQSITNGRAGVMPNLGLPGKNVVVLSEYVRHLSGQEVTPFVKEVGPERFAVCVACHGADGKGNQALGAPNLTDQIWLHGSSSAEIQQVLRNGVQGNMPSFAELLSETEIKMLAAYILSINPQAQALSE